MYFVYREDELCENGGIGLEAFSSTDDALEYIQQRLAEPHTQRTVENYRLIRGEELTLYPIEVTTRVGWRA
jgi:hypothetical protein